MMVLFCGRSSHTVKMPNKPISQGYKIYALCDHGYTYNFTFYSPLSGYAYVHNHQLGFPPTSNALYDLALSLPYSTYRFDIYMDNYFSNVPVFQALLAQGIGAMGTARVTANGFQCL